MNKKKIIMIAGIVLVVIIIGLIVAYNKGLFYRVSEQQKRFMDEINDANSIVWYYGNLDPEEEITINYEKVTEFTEETIGDLDNKYDYHTIVIYDFDGQMDVSDEELLLIKDYCENRYYDLLYYGTAHFEQFSKCGYFKQLDKDDYGFTYNGSYWKKREMSEGEEYMNPYLLLGIWRAQDDEKYDTNDNRLMWKFTIGVIEELIRDSKGELE